MANGKGEEKKSIALKYPSRALPNAFPSQCAVVVGPINVEVIFLDPRGETVLFRLVIDRGSALTDSIVGRSKGFLETCLKWLADKNVAIEPLVSPPAPGKVGAVTPVSANVFRLGRVGTEAVLEGYYASPIDLHAAGQASGQSKRVDLQAVCNIPMSLPVMVGLLQKLTEVANG